MRIAVLTRQISHYHHARFTALAEAGANFEVVSLANEGNFAGFVANVTTDYETHRVYNGKAEYADAVREGRISHDVTALLDSIRPDLVALPGWASAESFVGLQWAYENNAALVMMSDSQATDSARSRWREAIKRRIISYCDAGFVAGDPHRDYLASLGMERARITRGYDVVDNAHFARGAQNARENAERTRHKLRLPARPYLLASSRFIAKKNLPALISAYAKVAEAQDKCPDLCLLGDGAQRALIEGLIIEHNIADRFHLLGLRSYDDLPAIYGLAEAFIHPALYEQWGLVVSEAGSSGLALAVSRGAGAAQLVEPGKNGVLFDPADQSDLQSAIATLINLSPAERELWGKRSAAILSDWGLKRFVTGLTRAVAIACDHAKNAHRSESIALPDRLLMRYMSRKMIMDVQ